MNKTLKVASDRAYDDTKSVLPVEVARGIYIEHPPSAQALKLLHLMIAKAGGAMAEDRKHDLKLSEIRRIPKMRNHDKASLVPLFTQLRAATFHFDDTDAQKISIGGFLDHAEIDYRFEDDTGEITVGWWFGGLFKKLAAKSNHWAILDRQTVFNLRSKYSILLFQHVASLVNLEHKVSQIFTIPDLRGMLGVSEGKLDRFANLNDRALKPAIAEVNQLARFTVTATPIKDGRHIDAVRISWEPKPDLTAIKRELNSPKLGREARRNGTAETPALAFPASGGLSASAKIDRHWRGLFEENVNHIQGNHLPDSKMVCDAFRKVRGNKLDTTDTERHFVNFCKQWKG